jgi:hypothetical protein
MPGTNRVNEQRVNGIENDATGFNTYTHKYYPREYIQYLQDLGGSNFDFHINDFLFDRTKLINLLKNNKKISKSKK